MTPEDEKRGRIAFDWWRALQPRPDGSGGDRGALARLRRAGAAANAAVEPEAMRLCRALGYGPDRLGTVAVAASVLAHVREHRPGAPFARALGSGAMSWLRFRRLIQAQTEDECLAAFRRAVALSGGAANVRDLAIGLLDWTDLRRRHWLYAYHDAPDPDPDAALPIEEQAA